ncbi:hypothetical protein HOU66_gp07 [Pectobacterium phage Arno160]|uniref:Uncharacterized protein n=1 Tax=Pectobacterium phage Arno160 TaxID=2488835 RepID=A0A3G8F2C9_9CAUD|nr:hypothetical protein HOU66_gp07 [Pectobacterium phage Arno160]AZF88069.1 hypothetical protein Arno160_gp07 [Pectobacterium phage Arno160]
MIKRKRKQNKAGLIAVRAYTVVDNHSGVTHFFPTGTRVVKGESKDAGTLYIGKGRAGLYIRQYLLPHHVI